MGYIPADAKWYIAEIIEEFQFEGEEENVVHLNMVLVRADSPDEAFARATALGEQSDMTYTNTDGNLVTVRFRGLHDLNVVHGDLEHGTELIYSRYVNVPESKLAAMVSSRESLGVFRPVSYEDE